ncbi:MAG: DUF1572 family protein [Bryobacterales bacterium]|nr:DUF1572 family protein [Bryobacterales bacterium]
MAQKFTASYLEDATALFQQYKKLAERAIEQVTDEQLFTALDEEANSIAVLMKHTAGTMRSRWTDFLTTDGEKPGRNRDVEFVNSPATRQALLAGWEQGWSCLFNTLASLTDADLGRKVTIYGESLSVVQAINRQIAHGAQHVGQIVLLAKHYAGARWHTLSIPRHEAAMRR